ncbi:MarR family protein [Kaistia soli DSM 19436]|uniref:MarR family protein n=1 Tax=Kaistia soli DSM 19436 TaxID=1122133 RepID=A0A1M4VF79_9HYPH|nr:winged helix-turn-helix domain-containing protein [Kaistia soli]SHE67545.1 MarR family protein [Kaistia soli DSM 19436]
MQTVDDASGLHVSVSELARMKGLSKQAISKRLGRLVEDGLIRTHVRGREKVVSLAEWDTVTRDVTDPAKVAGARTRSGRNLSAEPIADGATSPEDAARSPSYNRELTRKAGYDADLKEIELRKQRGELRTVQDIQAAATKVGETLVRLIEQLPTHADDIATAHGRGGASAVRDLLKAKARGMREAVVQALEALAAGAEESDATQDDIN